MSRFNSIILAALAGATVMSAAKSALAVDSVALIPSLVTATAVNGGATLTPPAVIQGSTLYIYGSGQAAVYTINYNVLASLTTSGAGFGSVAANFTTSAGVTIPSSPYTANNAAVWTFTLPGSNTATINNTYNGTNLVASIGPYTSADTTRSSFAQAASAPVGQMKFQWDGTTNNATIKLNDTTGDNVLNQIQFQTDDTSTGQLSAAAFTGGQLDVQFIKPLGGDANFDGSVNSFDLSALGGHWQQTGLTGGASVGDFNNDGSVNSFDLSILGGNWQKVWTTGLTPAFGGGAIAAAPEPASLGLLAVGAAALLTRRKKA